jgi:SAM-dependent methyltransferase
MHISALQAGQKFFDAYWRSEFTGILDIGSFDVNGSLRQVSPPDAKYTGIDLGPGKGVDLVLDDPYDFPFPAGSFDMIVSTSCFEHDRLFWLTFLEAARVLSDRGFLYINAPSRAPYHFAPDRWRFFPDAGVALEYWGRRSGVAINLIESFLIPLVDVGGGQIAKNMHVDCVMMFTKARDFVPARYLCDELFGARWIRKGSNGKLLANEEAF